MSCASVYARMVTSRKDAQKAALAPDPGRSRRAIWPRWTRRSLALGPVGDEYYLAGGAARAGRGAAARARAVAGGHPRRGRPRAPMRGTSSDCGHGWARRSAGARAASSTRAHGRAARAAEFAPSGGRMERVAACLGVAGRPVDAGPSLRALAHASTRDGRRFAVAGAIPGRTIAVLRPRGRERSPTSSSRRSASASTATRAWASSTGSTTGSRRHGANLRGLTPLQLAVRRHSPLARRTSRRRR